VTVFHIDETSKSGVSSIKIMIPFLFVTLKETSNLSIHEGLCPVAFSFAELESHKLLRFFSHSHFPKWSSSLRIEHRNTTTISVVSMDKATASSPDDADFRLVISLIFGIII